MNEPIVGVNVIIEGTSIGTVTDVEGRYTIESQNPDAVVVIVCQTLS